VLLLPLGGEARVDRVAQRLDGAAMELDELGLVRESRRNAPAATRPRTRSGRSMASRIAFALPIECPTDERGAEAERLDEGAGIAGESRGCGSGRARSDSPCPRWLSAKTCSVAGRCASTDSKERHESVMPCSIRTGVPPRSPCSA
jgi:hypothetical protein